MHHAMTFIHSTVHISTKQIHTYIQSQIDIWQFPFLGLSQAVGETAFIRLEN